MFGGGRGSGDDTVGKEPSLSGLAGCGNKVPSVTQSCIDFLRFSSNKCTCSDTSLKADLIIRSMAGVAAPNRT
jgi:hypothetical protein